MSNVDLKARYDEFQANAVNAVVADFKKDAIGRFLLVIPTGGGKTYTAVKSVCEMYRQEILDSKVDRVLWIAHRSELIEQARETFWAVIGATGVSVALDEQILVEMVGSSKSTMKADTAISLVVIDEAHHAAANSYLPVFEQDRAGVLGLTATPSRHDGLPLEFQKESYSIGFPDLVKRGIILRPKVHKVEGGEYEIGDFTEEQLEQLNDVQRNQRIVSAIKANLEDFQKVIIYAATKNHARDLYEFLGNSSLAASYESISFITGDGNSRSQSRSDFIAQEKTYERSILVNVQVLSEGYDDPRVNTVVMAAPSKSKLYYMQALGRAIRQDPDNAEKQAHVVEVIDTLPNIRYRIDNRWLYSDISDALEPAVIDYEYSSADNLKEVLDEVYSKYSVEPEERKYASYSDSMRYSLLLFRQYVGEELYRHIPILIDNDNRLQVSNAFNFLSERMKKFVTKKYNAENVFRMIEQHNTGDAISTKERRFVYDAMSNSYHAMQPDFDGIAYIGDGVPWVTFASLNFRASAELIDEELLDYISEMVNKEEVYQRLINRDYEIGEFLLRLPQPLTRSIGLFVTPQVGDSIATLVSVLSEMRATDGSNQIHNVEKLIKDSVLQIETKYANSIVLIARDELEFKYVLNK